MTTATTRTTEIPTDNPAVRRFIGTEPGRPQRITEQVATRYIARAKHRTPDGEPCKATVSVLATVTYRIGVEYDRWKNGRETRRFSTLRLPDDAVVAGWVHEGSVQFAGACPGCGRSVRMYANAVKGTYSATQKCHAKCTGAVGPSCDCSCGGANHGADHG